MENVTISRAYNGISHKESIAFLKFLATFWQIVSHFFLNLQSI